MRLCRLPTDMKCSTRLYQITATAIYSKLDESLHSLFYILYAWNFWLMMIFLFFAEIFRSVFDLILLRCTTYIVINKSVEYVYLTVSCIALRYVSRMSRSHAHTQTVPNLNLVERAKYQ